jgi:hypothetical protein
MQQHDTSRSRAQLEDHERPARAFDAVAGIASIRDKVDIERGADTAATVHKVAIDRSRSARLNRRLAALSPWRGRGVSGGDNCERCSGQLSSTEIA